MSRVGDTIIEVCELYEDGYKKSEIAEKLGLTMEWVESALEYYKELTVD